MSFVVLHADQFTTALATNPIVPAAQIDRLRDTLALFEEAGRVRDEARGSIAEARELGRAEGYEAGRREGRAAGEEEIRAEHLRLTVRARDEEPRRRAEIATLALEVVRRIAGELGDPAVVAGLAERAAATVSPDQAAVVRVAPPALAEAAARLRDRPGVTVEADPALSGTDCVVETPYGRTHAGLDVQLAQVERVFREIAGGG